MTKILLVDGEEIQRRALEMMIRSEFPGLEMVPSAASGLELIASAECYAPDIAIVNVSLPGISGLSALEMVRARNRSMKFILFSAQGDFEIARGPKKPGVNFYAALKKQEKPPERIALANLCARLLRENRLEDCVRTVHEAFDRGPIQPEELSPARITAMELVMLVSESILDGQDELLRYARSGRLDYSALNLCQTLQQLADWIEGCMRTLAAPYIPEEKKGCEYVRRCLIFMEYHYAEDMSLEQAAEASGVSPFYLSRLLKQALDQSFVQLLTQIRMREALHLIWEKRFTAREIAERTGYRSVTYFYKVFKRYTVSVLEGIVNAGYNVTSSAWLQSYLDAYEKGEAEFQGGMWDVFSMDEPEITDADIEAASAADTAIYVISRNSGEGADRTATEGDYYLNQTERDNLAKLGQAFENVIVLLNVGGVIDTNFYTEIEGLDALLLMSQAGMEGGNALVQVLNGEVTPSGKLSDTWAAAYADYPSSENFGQNDGDVVQEDYTDGIYVGYRYFDTFGVAPAYEFGYGLSYTDFDITVDAVEADVDRVTVTATVTNTGDTYSGKEVVQVYFSAPDGELEKPYQELAAYAKTDELAPGQSQTLTISYITTEMSSYDAARAAYILEAGDYVIRVGNSSRNTEVAAIVRLDATAVTEQLSNQMVQDKEIETLSKEGATPYTYEGEAEQIAAAQVIELAAADIATVDNSSPYDDETVTAYVSDTTETEYLAENLSYAPNSKYSGAYSEEVVTFEGDYSGYTLRDVYDGTISIEEFVSSLTVSQMADIVIGGNKLPKEGEATAAQSAGASSDNASGLSDGTIIGAQANAVNGGAGETAGIYIESEKIPNIVLADGPAGLRITQQYESDGQTYYQFCTAWPIGTLLAQTWDTDVVRQVGEAFGEELKEYGVTILLAPGMNLHRNPLCGRNFEYYSEDPYLTGTTGLSIATGIQTNPGVGVCLKHYAGNNQEANRNSVNNTIDERTMRELYLKGFEIAVKGAQPMAVMGSYNLNEGVPASDDYDMMTDILRGEWGFQGLVMTDWGGGQSTPSISMHAGNDLIMPGSSVEDISVRGFTDEEPTFGEDDIYPTVTISSSPFGMRSSETWGEFVLSAEGSVEIVKTVDTAVYEAAERDAIGADGVTSVKVSELIANLGEGASVVDNGDGTTTITYKGDYKENNITLGDLQKSVIHILNVIMESNQFADLFEDVESESYTQARADVLVPYIENVKSDVQ